MILTGLEYIYRQIFMPQFGYILEKVIMVLVHSIHVLESVKGFWGFLYAVKSDVRQVSIYTRLGVINEVKQVFPK